jgi:two-component system sensor histidine kinase/response regulator
MRIRSTATRRRPALNAPRASLIVLGLVVGVVVALGSRPFVVPALFVIAVAMIALLLVGRLLTQLARERNHSAAILKEANDAYVAMDRTGLVLDWNRQAEATFGWTYEQARGQPVAELIIPPRYREAHRQGLHRYLDTGDASVLNKPVELNALHRDGHEFPIEITIWPLEDDDGTTFSAFVRDITKRLETEEALRRSEARKTALLESIAEGVITTDADGRITSINPAMERLSGWRQVEVVGRNYSEVYPAFDAFGEQVSQEERILTRALADKAIVTSRGFDMFFRIRDGRRVPVSATAAPISGGDGESVGAVEVVRDVSDEQEVDQLKSSLVSTVSHELRTPLTMIQGFSELLLTRDLAEKRSREALQQINASAERLSRLIEDLLSVSRIDSGRLVARTEPERLDEIIDEVVVTFERREERSLVVEVDPHLPKVMADRDKLVQILTNLISNALKYSAPPTQVKVTAAQVGATVQVAVIDSGIGLTEEEQSQLFNKFFRADRDEVRDAGGTGLGLYIAKSLVEMQDGQLWVNSEPGRGSTFQFSLPVASEDDNENVAVTTNGVGRRQLEEALDR